MMSSAVYHPTEIQSQNHAQVYLACRATTPPYPKVRGGISLSLLTVTLVTLQILDGILTYTGMLSFGISAEGNPLLRSLMNFMGVLPAITITKLLCISVVLALCAQAHRISWLPAALSCVAGIYTIAAILPWSWLLVSLYVG